MLDTSSVKSTRPNNTLLVRQAIDDCVVLPGVVLSDSIDAVRAHATSTVSVPSDPAAKRAFLRQWARKNMRRLATGLGVITLVLPLADAAIAQTQNVDVSSIDGVSSVRVAENGNLEITLENGTIVQVPKGSFIESAGGGYLVGPNTVEQIVAAGTGTSGGEGGAGAIAAIAGLVAVGAAAGGGGSGGGAAPAPAAIDGFLVDGYIAGATLFGDANGNAILDEGETSTTTAADGSFNAALFDPNVPLVAVGGVDISTGEAFTGTLKAPPGSTVVTPLTTLVQAAIESDESGTPPTPEQAAASVAASLGLTGADLLNDDPAELAEGGDVAQLQAAAKVAAVINLVTAAAPDNPDSAVDAVLADLSDNLSDGEGGDPFEDPAQIQAALDSAGDDIQVDTTALAEALVDVAAEVEDANDVNDLEGVQSVVQGSLTEAVENSVGPQEGPSDLDDANASETFFDNAVGLRPVISVFSPVDGDELANGASVNVAGSGRPGTTVTVALGDASEQVVVDDHGGWSVTLETDYVADGTQSDVPLVVTATQGEVTSAPATGAPTYTVDAEPPELGTPTLTGFDGASVEPSEFDTAALSIAGTEAGATVEVVLNGNANGGSATADASGNASFNLNDLPGDLPFGQNTVVYTVTDAAGNETTSAPITFTVAAELLPTVSTVTPSDASPILNDAQVDVAGIGRPGSTVTVTLGNAVASVDVAANGSWSVSLTGGYVTDGTEGTPTLDVRAADGAETSAPVSGTPTFTVDAEPPQLGTPTLTGFDGPTVQPDEFDTAALSIAGTDAGATVEVVLNGNANGASATADASGNASFNLNDLPGDLPFGQNTVVYTVTDAAGNETTSAPIAFTVAAELLPTVSTVTPSDASPIQNDEQVDVAGTGRPGSTVTVTLGNAVASAEVAANGSWSVSLTGDYVAPGTESTQTLSVSAADGAETSDPVSNTPEFTVDDIAPDAGSATLDGDDNGTINGLAINSATIEVANAEGGAAVVAVLNGNTPGLALQTQPDGSLSIDISSLPGDPIDGANSVVYTITDAAGNETTSTAVTFTFVPPTNSVTLLDDSGDPEFADGDLILNDSSNFDDFQPGVSAPTSAIATGVPAGTVFTITLTSTDPAFEETYTSTATDADGNFQFTVPDDDLLGLNPMGTAATVTFAADGVPPSTFSVLINSELGKDDNDLILVGKSVVLPAANVETFLNDNSIDFAAQNGIEVLQSGEVGNDGRGLVTAKIVNSDGDDFALIGLYDGESPGLYKAFFFDGGPDTTQLRLDVSAFFTSTLATGDGLFILQGNVTGTADPIDVQQAAPVAFTLYNIPFGSLDAAIPAFGDAANFNKNAPGITMTDISLSDIDPDYAGGALPPNITYSLLEQPADDGTFVAVVEKRNELEDELEALFLVTIDTSDGSVESVVLDAVTLSDGDLPNGPNDFLITNALESDADGNPTSINLPVDPNTPPDGDGTYEAYYDYVFGALGVAVFGDDDSADLLLAAEGVDFFDGGDESDFSDGLQDNDLIIVGNTDGDEGNVNIEVANGRVTVSVDAAIASEIAGATINFDVFLLGASYNDGLVFGTGVTQVATNPVNPVENTSSIPGTEVQRFSIELDPTDFVAVNGKATLVSFDATGVGVDDVYAIGFNNYEDDFDTVDPDLFTYQKVNGLEDSGAKYVFLQNSGGSGGQDAVIGFDASEGDSIFLSTDTTTYRGSGIETVPDGGTLTVGQNTGILLFEEVVPGLEDANVATLANSANLGLQDESILVLVGDGEATFVYNLSFDSNGDVVTTDSASRLDGVSATDFNASNLILDPNPDQGQII